MRDRIKVCYGDLTPNAFEAALVDLSCRYVFTYGEPVNFQLANAHKKDRRRLSREIRRLRDQRDSQIPEEYRRLDEEFIRLMNN